MAAQNPNPSTFLGAGNFTALDTLASPTGTCRDPHPNAVIRLERIRDNPSSLYVGGYVASGAKTGSNKPLQAPIGIVCGVDPVTGNLPMVGVLAPVPWKPTLYDFWPNTLFDTREGTLRDTPQANGTGTTLPPPTLNGTMHYIELDAGNVASWFGGKIGTLTTSGQGTKDPAVAPNDFVVYISDRRGNYSLSQTFSGGWPPLSYTQKETGEFGWNDLVNNPATSTSSGCPDAVLNQGEDADGTNVMYTYGANESYIHGVGVTPVTSLAYGQIGLFRNLPGSALSTNNSCPTVPPYVSDGIWPMMVSSSTSAARENPALFFRRAVKLVNGTNLSGVGTCPGGNNCGLAIATENPVYIQGDYNANYGGIGFANSVTNVAASVAADAVTLLSDNWNDTNSFSSPYSWSAGRTGVTSWYRAAIVGRSDASLHECFRQRAPGLRHRWRGAQLPSLHRRLERHAELRRLHHRFVLQPAGQRTFKCCTTVYNPPSRGYKFDSNFLTPALLPPRTPLFRDVNTTGWTRLLLPTQ